MATTLKVAAHWGGLPSTLATYPGSAAVGTYWCELAAKADIDQDALGTGAPHPPGGDQGYAPPALDFSVQEITLLPQAFLNGEWEVEFISPGGQLIGSLVPVASQASTLQLTGLNVVSGRGIWTLKFTFLPTTPPTPPIPGRAKAAGSVPYAVPPAAPDQPYVVPNEYQGGNVAENFMLVEFVGITVECPTPSLAIVGQPGPCDQNGQRGVYFTVSTSTPAGIDLDFGDGHSTAVTPGLLGTPLSVQVPPATGPPHPYSPGTYTVTATITAPPGCQGQASLTITIPPCPVQCTDRATGITVDQVSACDPQNHRLVTVTATVSGGSVKQYTWQWDAHTPADPPILAPAGATPPPHSYDASGSVAVDHTVFVTVEWTNGCTQTISQVVSVPPCGPPCPTLDDITVSEGPCDPDGMHRPVTFTPHITGAATGQFDWIVDGLSFPGFGGPLTIDMPADGQTHTVELKIFDKVSGCAADLSKTFTVDLCCPVITDITATPGDCSTSGSQRAVTLTAATTGAPPDSYTWDFGDGSAPFGPPGAATTPAHQYSPGSYTVTLTIARAGCPQNTFTKKITVDQCPTSGGGGESLGCGLLRWLIVILLAASVFVVIVALCLPNLSQQVQYILYGIAIGLAVAAVIAFLIWLFLCPSKPCAWGLLLAWQVLLATGLISLYLTACCPVLWFGLIAVVVGVVLMIVWGRRCKKSLCAVLAELGPVIAMTLSVAAIVKLVPVLNACVTNWVVAVVSGISTLIAFALAACILRSGTGAGAS
jgi:PKD repeat protein